MTRIPLWLGWLVVGAVVAGGQRLLDLGLIAGDFWLHGFSLACIVMMIVGIRRNGPARPAKWYFLMAGLALTLAGDLIWTICSYALDLELKWPTPIDGIYLGTYPLLAVGLFLLIRGRTAGGDRGGLIDAAIVTTGVGLLCWVFVLRPIFDDQSLGLVARLVSLGYPLGDLLLLVMLARLLTSPGAKAPSYWFLIGAIVLNLGADTGFAMLDSYDGGGVLDLIWSASNLLWVAAALHPSMRSLSEPTGDHARGFTRWRLAMLAGASLLAPAVLAVQGVRQPRHIDWSAITACAVVLFLLVLNRMSGLVRQIGDQAAQLAAMAHHDALTGVANRRAWDGELARAVAAAHRSAAPLTVALIDLDHFKRFNDAYGHQAGDALLRDAAHAWRADLRPDDFLARYGERSSPC